MMMRLPSKPTVEVLADLVNCPFFRFSLPVIRVAPYAAALGLLHHQNGLRVTLDLLRILFGIIAFSSLISAMLILDQKQ